MVELYTRLISSKRRTIDSVPAGMKSEVVERLKALGFDTNGDPLGE